ncbi:MAG TPA: ATP-binding protein [Gemmatimonas sp.]|nr:ATP-binding protein [Gemmatimonas sp.]
MEPAGTDKSRDVIAQHSLLGSGVLPSGDSLDFRAIFEAAPGVNLVLAPDAPHFTMLAASDERLAATLTTRGATVGRPLFQVFADANPDNLEASGVANLRESLDTVLRTRAPHHMAVQRYDLQTPDGIWEVRYWAPRNVPVLDSNGDVRFIVHHVSDITELVRQGEATVVAQRAHERSERLQQVTAALAGARTIDDVATVVVADMVVALGARTGALARRADDGDALVLFREVGFPEHIAAGVRRQSLDLTSPLTYCFRTQSPVWIESRDGPDGLDCLYPLLAPVWDALGVGSAAFVPLVAAGDTVGVISFSYVGSREFDPSDRGFLLALGQQAALAVERARLFEAERSARAEAEAANRGKSEFLAVMSHELRTPLNAIGGYAALMELGIRGPVSPEQLEDLRRIKMSQLHLLGLVNDVLNYVRLETGTVRYDVSDVRLAAVIAEVEPLIAPQLEAKALAFSYDGCRHSSLVARADQEKLRQVLLNLLSNAIKFTARGGWVELACEAAGDRVLLRVRDNGIGIAAEELQRVFEPFVQVNSSLTRTNEGAGLGLSISRDLARGMGGDLTVDSELGTGSTFTLVLPRGA